MVGRIVLFVVEMPSGTVTFLFTDIEDSTRLWERHREEMSRAVARHDELVWEAIDRRGGRVFATGGDGVAAAFDRAVDAIGAATEAQRLLAGEAWPEATPIRVRMGIHTGEAQERGGDYFGPALNRASRLTAIGHGGQVLVSHATEQVARDAFADVSVELRELGEHQLRDLSRPERVFQVVAAGLVVDFPALRSLDALPGNLPRQLTSFVGREREVELLVGLVHERSLVTLTGVGGVGKTRLAVQVAADVVAEFADGAWLCELASVADPDAVWETLAAALGIVPAPGRDLGEVVLEYLAPKQLLLVLDNCEHLLGPVASVVGAVGQRCERLSILATSREGLALAGEQMVAVPSLGVPAEGAGGEDIDAAEAVRLFCDRAHDADNNFVLGEHAGAVAQLCRRLDGIPLAIELAAARVRSLAPEDLVARLDQRFKLLTRGSRAALERHQTLRNTIDWSYDLLTDNERVALNRMSVFAGGCDLTAAEAVLAGGDLESVDAADVLGQLVDKSLVLVDHDTNGARYRLLETIRQYAQERLERTDEIAAVRGRHLDHYVGRAETAGPHLRGRDQLAWAATLAADVDNFRTALDVAVEASLPDPALRLVAALAVTGLPIGWTVMGWTETACTIPGAATHPLYPLVVAYAALDATLRGDLERAAPLVDRAEKTQAALGTDHMWVHTAAATLALFQGEFEVGQHHAEICVEHARASGDPYELALALTQLAGLLTDEPARGVVVAEEAVRVARDAGILSALPFALVVYLGFVGPEDPVREIALLDEVIAVASAVGDHRLVATTVALHEGTKFRQGDWPAVLRAHVDAAEQYRDGGNMMQLVGSLRIAAAALAAMEHFEPAAIILGFTDAHFARYGNEEYTTALTATDAALLGALGEQRVTELNVHGATLDYAEALTYLRAEADRALAH